VQRTARCSCRAVQVEAEGEPGGVVACHCLECQRRTGSVFGVGAYYAEAQVRIRGATKEYSRPTDSGSSFVTHFCLACGSTVFWRAGKIPGTIGIAVGAFGDPTFPAPIRSVWEQSMHGWVQAAPGQHHPRGRGT
jgi:hypothetical protein